jgi:predicted nucleotidyltransferase
MHLAEPQLAIIRTWAEATKYVRDVRLFGSYAKGTAHERSDIDLAISADTGHYVALVEEWERYLTDALGPTVHIRDFLRNEAIRIACDECSLPIYSTASDC